MDILFLGVFLFDLIKFLSWEFFFFLMGVFKDMGSWVDLVMKCNFLIVIFMLVVIFFFVGLWFIFWERSLVVFLIWDIVLYRWIGRWIVWDWLVIVLVIVWWIY